MSSSRASSRTSPRCSSASFRASTTTRTTTGTDARRTSAPRTWTSATATPTACRCCSGRRGSRFRSATASSASAPGSACSSSSSIASATGAGSCRSSGPDRPLAHSARALVPVRARLADEPLEQREVVALLRVPQHAEGEARTGILERLGRAVLHRPRDLFQATTYTTVGLVVMRLHRSAVAEDRRETAPAAQVDVVVGERAGCVLVPLGPHYLG